jgi:hypothetical protein
VAALAAAAAMFAGLGVAPSAAQAVSGYGYDVSYPQCGKTLPSSAAFAVIGVNGGQPFKDNRCLGEQFRWVRRVNADYGFYANSANPGPAHPEWGQGGTLPCGGAAAEWGCAYNFGQDSAKHAFDYAERVTKAAAGHRFWVDVETANTWSKTDKVTNIAVLQGMVDYLTVRSGRTTGVYGTPNHWKQITGNAQAASVPTWFAAAKNRTAAAAKCAGSGLLSGGPLLMVQFVVKGLDHNYWCGRSVA